MKTVYQGIAYEEGMAHSGLRRIFLMIVCSLLVCFSTINSHAQSTITVVQNIADLRALSTTGMTNDTMAYVIDYYGPTYGNSRGGGHFRWVSNRMDITGLVPVDDGGRFINCTTNTNGIWERIFAGEIPNVKMWGAYGDAIHDDTVALQNALGASNTYVGEMLIPSGTYMISNTLVINPTIVHLRGENPENTTIEMKLGYNADIFQTSDAHQFITTGSGSYDQGMIFENMALKFQDDGSPNGHPARNTNNACLVVGLTGEVSSIRNVYCLNGGVGIRCFAGGTPGLNIRDCNCSEMINGVLIAPPPGDTNVAVGGQINIIGLSGDQNFGDVAAVASLVVVSNADSLISISSVKAEGDWGGGLIHYYCGSYGTDLAHFSIRECDYNAGFTEDSKWFPPDFIKVDASSLFNVFGLGPAITIEQVKLNAVANLINDTINGRIVDSDAQIDNGLRQITAWRPIVYTPNLTGSGTAATQGTGSTLFIGDQCYTTFYATNAGWYRIMAPVGNGSIDMGGRVFIGHTVGKESIEMQVDVTSTATPLLTVTRCKAGSPVITQARAVVYPTSGGNWAALDVYVGNPFSPSAGKDGRLTVGLDPEGATDDGGGHMTQLLSPVIPVSATLPTGSIVTTVNTYR